MSRTNQALLLNAAERAAQRPEFLGWVLVKHMANCGIDSKALAASLRCTPDTMPRLFLCRRPRSEQFAQDIAFISARLSIDGGVLSRIVRQVESITAMTANMLPEVGTLLAARTRPESETSVDDRA